MFSFDKSGTGRYVTLFRIVFFSRKSLLTGKKPWVRRQRSEHRIVACRRKKLPQARRRGVAKAERRHLQQLQNGADHGGKTGVRFRQVGPFHEGSGSEQQCAVGIDVVEAGGSS